jgi:hypothetical protein
VSYIERFPKSIEGLTEAARQLGEWRRERIEGTTVRVLSPDRETATALAPAVAARLYRDRVFAEVLHAEQEDEDSWLVTVRDAGPRYFIPSRAW